MSLINELGIFIGGAIFGAGIAVFYMANRGWLQIPRYPRPPR